MKKLLFLLMTSVALTACSSNEESITDEERTIETKVDGVKFVVKGNRVISPEWIDQVRENYWNAGPNPKGWDLMIVCHLAEHNGVTVVWFSDSSSSWGYTDCYIYSLSGQKSETRIPTEELTNFRIICPAFLAGSGIR